MEPLNVKILLNRQGWKNSITRVHSAHKKQISFKEIFKVYF